MANRRDKKKTDKAGKDAKPAKQRPIPDVLVPKVDSPPLVTKHGSFDLDDPVLPDWVERDALKSGGYPYDDTMKDKLYEEELETLQVELVKLQADSIATGRRAGSARQGRGRREQGQGRAGPSAARRGAAPLSAPRSPHIRQARR